jgi:hypothetical protein
MLSESPVYVEPMISPTLIKRGIVGKNMGIYWKL